MPSSIAFTFGFGQVAILLVGLELGVLQWVLVHPIVGKGRALLRRIHSAKNHGD
jgi:hypothetical protein